MFFNMFFKLLLAFVLTISTLFAQDSICVDTVYIIVKENKRPPSVMLPQLPLKVPSKEGSLYRLVEAILFPEHKNEN